MSKPLCGPDYLKLPRNQHLWIVEPLLPIGGSVLFFGKPKSGKSLAALQMASCISDANVSDFLGFPIRTHGPVLYFQLDTNRGIWMQDMENGIQEGFSFDEVLVCDKEIAPRPFDARTNGSQYMQEMCREIKPLVVVIDTLRKCHDGDENDSGQMKQILEKVQLSVGGAALVLVAHSRKEQKDFEDLMGDMRGSSFIAGEVDMVVKVTKKRFTYEGRTIEERRLDLKRTPLGFWALSDGDLQQKMFALLAKEESKAMSTNQLAHMLSQETGLNVEACRGRIRTARGEM